ncbi:MAG: hypothetical protein H7Y03_15050 [Chitinophagaceae bacterium]|nr:hypothetical protein [Chitinophagaceae bacterium]
MAKFISRIELYNAEEKDYHQLALEMQKELFIPVRSSRLESSGHIKKASEFNRHGNVTLQEVTTATYKAAKRTGKDYAFTIIKDKTFPSQYPVSGESY